MYARSAIPGLCTVILLFLVNLGVELIAWTGPEYVLEENIRYAQEYSDYGIPILILGDSKTGFFASHGKFSAFFGKSAFVFGYDSTTILYHRLQYRRLIERTDYRPRVVFIMLGANNFNLNGLHIIRDAGARLIATWGELCGFWGLPDSGSLLLEGIFSRILPIYGHRIELTHLQFRRDQAPIQFPRADPPDIRSIQNLRFTPPARSLTDDNNYLLIYERSVYRNYVFSHFHLAMLEQLIEDIRANGGEAVLVQLPVEQPVRDLERRLVGDRYDREMTAFAERQRIALLDLRQEEHYEFKDVNHLSFSGARDVAQRHLDPLARRIIVSGDTRASGLSRRKVR